MDTKELIQQLINQDKIKNSHQFDSMIFHDEPILKTARQASNWLPKEIADLKELFFRPDLKQQSEEYRFYVFGKQMEKYEDDFCYHGTFFRYFPSYQAMSNEQLRGYFSWRTKTRKGQIEKTSLSFVYVYLYELMNQIGVDSNLDGYEKLTNFLKVYRLLDERIINPLTNWIKDYVIYYHLNPLLLKDLEDPLEKNLQILYFGDASLKQQFEAIDCMSTYSLKNSKIYQLYPEKVQQIVVLSYQTLKKYYQEKKKISFFEKLFKKKKQKRIYLFQEALFYPLKKENEPYVANELTTYFYQNHQWFKEGYETKKSKDLGYFCLTIEGLLKNQEGLENKNLTYHIPLEMVKKIKQVIEQYEKMKKKANIVIRPSALNQIRQNALKTFQSLVTKEELEEEPILQNTIVEEGSFTQDEKMFLSLILKQQDYHTFVKEKKGMCSLLVEQINEKCFEHFQDNVLEINDADVVTIIEDYLDELKGMITI